MATLNKVQRKPHPRAESNIFSHFFFIWQLPVLFKGYCRKQLIKDNLYSPLTEHTSKFLGDKLEKAWQKEFGVLGTDASLWKVLVKVFGKQLAFYGLIAIPTDIISRLLIPFSVWKILSLYTSDNFQGSEREVYSYVSLMVLAIFINLSGSHYSWFEMEHLGAKIRIACTSLIYRKCLNLGQESLMKLSVGQIVNLLAADVSKFNCGLIRYIHYLWLMPVMTFIILYLLYVFLGASSLIGMSLYLAFLPFQIYISKRNSVHRLNAALRTDQRVRLINEVVGGIKVIKMLAWEPLFTKLITNCRKHETQEIKASLYYYSTNAAITFFLNRIVVFTCILPHILVNNTVTSEYIFAMTSFYDVVKLITLTFFAFASIFLGEIITSVKRIESFLKTTEIEKKHENNNLGITLAGVSINNHVLRDVSLQIYPNQLVAIVGSVGCGKTTLLKVILQEISLLQGTLQVGGTISYASQDSWIFGDTVKDNVLFGENFDEVKYNTVLKVCSLEHDLKILPDGDLTFVEDKGAALSGGQKSRINLARAVYRDADIYLLDDPLSAVDVHVGDVVFRSCLQEYLRNKLRILVTHQLQYLDRVDFIYLMENGRIVDSGTYEDLKTKNYFKSFQTETNVEITEEVEEKIIEKETFDGLKNNATHTNTSSISRKVYTGYLKAGAGLFLTITLILLHVLMYMVASVNEYILTFWVNLEQLKKAAPSYLLNIYISSAVLVVLLPMILEYVFVKFFVTASKNLHAKMLRHVIFSPMSFFSNHTCGQILNRFSSDVGQIDRQLTTVITDVSICTVHFLVITSLIAIINHWTLHPILILLVIFYFARHAYLSTARVFKRMEASYRSPVFSHVTNTLQGLVTIRALDSAENQKNLLDAYQDMHTSSQYMFLACESAFGFWLDVCCLIFFVVVILILVVFQPENYAGNIGLSVVCCTGLFGMTQYGVKRYAELENQMVSVERVLEYTEIGTEPGENTKLTINWPTYGKIEFQEVSLRYHPHHPLVLEQVTFVINPKEKIGIVGRTGAGKSSLISVIFRLFEFEGNILIDGINTKSLPLQVLRSKITIIPQEPVLFSSSIRTNLDPFEEYDDTVLWNALEEVELKNTISAIPAGLSSKLSEGGLSFSVGQKQLLCLARAIVRKNVILIMDEATANVDLKTDELIRKTIRRKFKECTVLTIAHRLDTVMECDRILVMGDGCCLEFDSPDKLLQNASGAFYKLLHRGLSSKAAKE